MIVIGAGGFATEVLEILIESYDINEIYFFDDVNNLSSDLLFNSYKILTSLDQVKEIFNTISNKYCIGLGGIKNKIKLTEIFNSIGGELTSVISKNAIIGKHNVSIGRGSVILPGVKISNNVRIGVLNLIYYNCVIAHDCFIDDYCEISPSVNILGNVIIGKSVWCGTNCTILPKLIITDDVIIGAGALVNKSIEIKATVVGVPAKEINSI